MGALSSLIVGVLADRLGRTTITIAALAVSGSCALLVGPLFGAHPALLVPLCLLWGLAVSPDSAQFSAATSELAPMDLVDRGLGQTSISCTRMGPDHRPPPGDPVLRNLLCLGRRMSTREGVHRRSVEKGGGAGKGPAC